MDYSVDPDELVVLARGFAAAELALAEVGTGTRLGSDLARIVGGPPVAWALHEVAASWSQARSRIRAELDGAARASAAAARIYADVEGAVAAAATPAVAGPDSARPR